MRRLSFFIVSMSMIFIMATPVLADTDRPYQIESAGWKTNGGRVDAAWDKTQAQTKFRISIYRQQGNGGRKEIYKETVSGHSVYAGPIIAYYGTGNYYFDVYPTKSGMEDGASSDCLDVDSDYLQIIKSQVGSDVTAVATAPKGPSYIWNNGPSGTWQLRKDGNLVTNQWAQVNGYWYLLDASGNMLKGWQERDGKMYYLNEVSGAGGYPEGACWLNGVTPDGHRVDASGARIS